MEVLLIVIFIIILVIAIKNSSQAEHNNVSCKMHKWIDVKQPDTDDTYMLCTLCNKTPSQIINEIPVDKA